MAASFFFLKGNPISKDCNSIIWLDCKVRASADVKLQDPEEVFRERLRTAECQPRSGREPDKDTE